MDGLTPPSDVGAESKGRGSLRLAADGGQRSESGIRFAGSDPGGYRPSMSTAVLELKQKVERLTSEERYELMRILEDIEDNALADKAEAEGGWTKLADLKKELGRA